MSTRNESHIARLEALARANIVLILILVVAAIFWGLVFAWSASDFVADGSRPFRGVWGGVGSFDLFGYTVYYDFEGYVDYDYYYYSWGERFLSGIAPYSDTFDRTFVDGTPWNTPYFFPPLYVYMCAFGLVLPIDPFGIGFIISLFGYLTAFPIYGISAFLAQNRRVGEISVLTYLFSPLVLFYTAFKWLNPAPFVFFVMLSFYLLMKGRRLSGALAMVTAALFKQTAFFLALPLIAYIMKRAPAKQPEIVGGKRPPGDELDLKGFAKIVLAVLVYLAAVSLPYLFDFQNYLYYIFQRPGGFLLEDLTSLPDVSQPISPAVLLIFLGAPTWLVDIVNKATYYSIFLAISMLTLLVLMLLQIKDDSKLPAYWRRLFFLTLLLMLCMHVFSPRGMYKYYCVALIPFFSIQSVSSMISVKKQIVKPSLFMLLNPILFGLLILIPNRYVYIAFIILMLLGYICHKQFSLVQEVASNWLRRRVRALRQSISRGRDLPVTAVQEDEASLPP